jgi:hypothetical protein
MTAIATMSAASGGTGEGGNKMTNIFQYQKGDKVVLQAQEPAVFAGVHYAAGEELEITLIHDVNFSEEGIGEGGPWGWGGFTSDFLEEISGFKRRKKDAIFHGVPSSGQPVTRT